MGKTLRRGFFAIAFVGLYWSVCTAIEFPTPDTLTKLENDELSVFQPFAWDDPPPGFTIPWVDGSSLVYVSPGEFIMGTDEENNPNQDNRTHTVSLGGFWIYRTEVTNRMYAKCVEEECDPPMVDSAIPDYTLPEQANKPVVGVTWEMAETYCKWARGRLPTEAQWEGAARGPTGNKFPWGEDEPTCDLLNFNDCVGEITAVDVYPDGSSYYGVLDMVGNVSEWVADWYQDDYYGEAPYENPMGPENGQARSIRSNSYQSGPEQVPSSQRFYLEPDRYRNDLGFRCVVEYIPINKPGLGITESDPPGSGTTESNPVCCGCLPLITSCKPVSDPPGSDTPGPDTPSSDSPGPDTPGSDPSRAGIAPFCETSFEVFPPEVESVDCPSPSIDIGSSYCQGDTGYVNAEVQACNQMTQFTGDGASCQEFETNKIACYGSSGTTAQLEVCCDCPDIQPQEWKCEDVQCPETYELDFNDCSCVYQAPPTVLMDVHDPPPPPDGGCCGCGCPSNPVPPEAKLHMMGSLPSPLIEQGNCMPGFAFDPLAFCCMPEKIPVPCQGVYDSNSHICQLPLPDKPKCVTEKFDLPPCNTKPDGDDGEQVGEDEEPREPPAQEPPAREPPATEPPSREPPATIEPPR